MKANNKELYRFLFEQMKKLALRKINAEEGKAQAGLARQANNCLRYELDKAKLLEEFKGISIKNIEQ